MKTTIIILFGSVVSLLAAPKLLPFQGHLTTSAGAVVPDGAKVVQFKIYDAPVSGNAVWAGEVHKLSVNKGLVNTILGTKTAFPPRYDGEVKVMFSEPLYVEITVDADNSGTITAADPPLLPRQVLLPANFAHVAQSAETVKGFDLVDEAGKLNPARIGVGSISSQQIADQSISETDLTLVLNQRLDLGLVPAGAVVPFAGRADRLPPGWLLCDGRALDGDSAQFASLFGVLDTKWGDGSSGLGAQGGVTNFNLPDLTEGMNAGVVDFESKFLSADVLASGNLAELNFDNLIVGDFYRVNFRAIMFNSSARSQKILINHNENIVGVLQLQDSQSSGRFSGTTVETVSTSLVFQAAVGQLEFAYVEDVPNGNDSGMLLQGGTDNGIKTNAQLERLGSRIKTHIIKQ